MWQSVFSNFEVSDAVMAKLTCRAWRYVPAGSCRS